MTTQGRTDSDTKVPLSVRAVGLASGRPGANTRLVDLVVLFVVIALPALGLLLEGSVDADPWLALAGLVVAVPLVLLRRRWPVAVLTVLVVLVVGTLVATGQRTPLVIAVIVLVFTVATSAPRRVALISGLACMAVLYTTVALRLPGAAFGPEGLATIAWPGLALASGFAVRNRADYIASVEERARRAEASLQEEARRRVAEERLRIARELHDVAAHQVTVMRVHSEVAVQYLTREPERARVALDQVRESAGALLHELGAVLRVLRAGDDSASTGPTAPTPGLGDLPALVASVAELGVPVVAQLPTAASGAPESVQAAAYRIVQEALTNAQRHGIGPVRVAVVENAVGVGLRVENAVALDRVSGIGLGLIGMRERADAVGGTLVAEQTGGQFLVAATFPAGAAVPV